MNSNSEDWNVVYIIDPEMSRPVVCCASTLVELQWAVGFSRSMIMCRRRSVGNGRVGVVDNQYVFRILNAIDSLIFLLSYRQTYST
jgi:hypothetical protein